MIIDFFVYFGLAWWILFTVMSVIIFFSITEDDFDDLMPRTAILSVLIALSIWLFFGNLRQIVQGFQWSVLFEDLAAYIAIGCLWGLFKWDRKNAKRRNNYNAWKVSWLKSHGVNASENSTIPDEFADEWEKYILEKDGWSIYAKVVDNFVEVHREISSCAAEQLALSTWKENYLTRNRVIPPINHYEYQRLLDAAEKVNPQWIVKTEIVTPRTIDKKILQIHIDPRNYKKTIFVWCAYWPWDALKYFLHDFVRHLWKTIGTILFRIMRKLSSWRMSGTEKDFKISNSIKFEE